jgi:hypothetical protein
MITMRDGEGAELVNVATWHEVLQRPGYNGNVNPEEVTLKAIIGNYVFPSDVPCGLSSCHQGHRRGYLVATNSGVVTNLGHVCGKNYFGVDFESMRRVFDREMRIRSYREQLAAFKLRIPELLDSIDELRSRERGANWVNRGIRILMSPDGLPHGIRRMLQVMARTSEDRLFIERAMTERERDITAQQRRGPDDEKTGERFVREQIGTLAGLQALREDADLRALLIIDLEAGLDRLAAMDVESAEERELSKVSRWVSEVEGKFELATRIVGAGATLLERDNLAQLVEQAEGADERAAVRAVIAKCTAP